MSTKVKYENLAVLFKKTFNGFAKMESSATLLILLDNTIIFHKRYCC